jgi:hypothetical protein
MWFSAKENHMHLIEAATLNRKSGAAEGSAVPRTHRGRKNIPLNMNLYPDPRI